MNACYALQAAGSVGTLLAVFEAAIDAITFPVHALIDAVAFPVQTVFYTVTAPVEPVFDTVAAIIRTGQGRFIGKCGKRQNQQASSDCQRVFISNLLVGLVGISIRNSRGLPYKTQSRTV